MMVMIESMLFAQRKIASTGADTVAVGCPFCSTMITDGLSAIGSEMEVKDIAEIVWEQIKANDAAIEAKRLNQPKHDHHAITGS